MASTPPRRDRNDRGLRRAASSPNFSSNMHLRSGLAPDRRAHRCGCAHCGRRRWVALDEDDDVLREMRLVQIMHRRSRFKRTWTPAEFFGLAVATAARQPVRLEPGRWCPAPPPTSSPSISTASTATRSCRSTPDPIYYSQGADASLVARRGCDGTVDRQRSRAWALTSSDRAGTARNLPRQCRKALGIPAGVATALNRLAKLVRAAAGLQLAPTRWYHCEFRYAEENSACISRRARFHGRQQGN